MLDRHHHQVAHVVAGDASRGGEEAHGFPITAVEREGDPHPLAVVALEAIGAPAPIGLGWALDPRGRPRPPFDGAVAQSRLGPGLPAALRVTRRRHSLGSMMMCGNPVPGALP
jgi:hypothetical protein